ncbi:MAG: DUF58 domain-containing protein [Anaerolineae bacterium]
MGSFLPFLLLLFVLAAVLRVDFFFTIVYLFVGVYIFFRLWADRAIDQLHVTRHFEDRAFLGDTVQVRLAISNRGRLPLPWLMFNETLPAMLTTPPIYRRAISLRGGERQEFTYMVQCRRRGYYPLGPLRLESGDLLGLAGVRKARVEPAYLTVYPKVLPLRGLNLPTHSPQVVLPTVVPLFEDPARVQGVRDYVRGDSPRRIHWTATARVGRLLVKQYQPAIARETSLFLNLNRADYPRDRRYQGPELAIVTAASLASHIISREKLPVGLVTDAYDPMAKALTKFRLPARKERAHLMAILEILARVQSADTPPFLDAVRRQAVHLSWGATVVVITARESSDLFDTLLFLNRTGFQVTLVLVQSTPTDPAWRQGVEKLGVPVHRVWNERHLEEWS